MSNSDGRIQPQERPLPHARARIEQRKRWRRPNLDESDYYGRPFRITIGPRSQIIVYTQFDLDDRLVDFWMVAQAFHNDAWWDIVRVDVCDGMVVAHYMYRTRDYEESDKILDLYQQQDVEEGYDLANTMLITCWTENLARWRDGS